MVSCIGINLLVTSLTAANIADMNLRAFEEVIAKLDAAFQPGSNLWVNVTNVKSPQNFYVRPTDFDDYLDILESFFDAQYNIEPKIQHMVFYRAQHRGGKIMRGQVVGFDKKELSTTCQLFALDYGYIDEEVQFQDIFPCNDVTLEVPPLALHCQLDQCAPFGKEWSEDSIEAFKFYLGEEQCKIIVKNNVRNKLIVDLYNSCPDNLAIMLSLTGYSNWGYVDPYASKIYSQSSASETQNIEKTHKYYFNFKERPINKTLQVRMLYYKNFENFYVAELDDYRKYKKLLKEITLNTLKERQIRIEELVVGRPVLICDKKQCGHRGIIKSVLSATEAYIQLVDCGKTVSMEKTNIKSIPRSLLEYPITAIYCRTDMLGRGMTVSSFKEPGFKFNISIEVAGHEFETPNSVQMN